LTLAPACLWQLDRRIDRHRGAGRRIPIGRVDRDSSRPESCQDPHSGHWPGWLGHPAAASRGSAQDVRARSTPV